MNKKGGNALVWILVIGAVAAFFIFRNNDSGSSPTNTFPDSRSYRNSETSENTTLSRDEAISEHWDEVKEYVDGTETVEACSSSSGNCYDLDADISSGVIEQIYFPSGGYLYFSADIDESGGASDNDQNGDGWDFTVDMSSSIVDDAVDNWANANGYTIE